MINFNMIYLGSDHGGFKYKEVIKKFLVKNNYDFKDLGNTEFDKDDDYPDYAFKVAEKVSQEKDSLGILLCRSSAGMVIAANKVKGIRAASVFDVKSTMHARQHNDANVIALSGDWLNKTRMLKIVKAFLETEFSEEKRHVRRLNKIKRYEQK